MSLQTTVNEKIIRDPVHGYISIPRDYIEKFIDTRQFQRLNFIKQTSLYVLYPSATHTRFEHSVGVFHIGRRILNSIVGKQDEKVAGIIEKFRHTIQLACLLHDVGHAPLSHLGEMFFSSEALKEELKKINYITTTVYSKAGAHELMSALVALKIFEKELDEFEVDKDFFVRLIVGETYDDGFGENNIKDCLINILYGYFDADKLDYIMRDSQSAGIPTLTLDMTRIIRSFNIKEDNGVYHYVIEKPGFSVACSIINNRNYLYFWVTNHHKVQYHCELVYRYLKKIEKENEEEFKKLFSVNSIIDGVDLNFKCCQQIEYFDDSDIFCLMKYYSAEKEDFSHYVSQIFGRTHFKPLWKTNIEYKQIIKSDINLMKNSDYLHTIAETDTNGTNEIEKKLEKLLPIEKKDFHVFLTNPKLVHPLSTGDAQVYMPEAESKIRPFTEVFKDFNLYPEKKDTNTLYIFKNPDIKISKNEFIAALSKIKKGNQ